MKEKYGGQYLFMSGVHAALTLNTCNMYRTLYSDPNMLDFS